MNSSSQSQSQRKQQPSYGSSSSSALADGGVVQSSSASNLPPPPSLPPQSQPQSQPQMMLLHIDDAIEMLGMGRFQYQILIAAGLCFMADSMEVLLLSFLATIVKHEWELSETQVSTIISVVFAGALSGTCILSPLGDVYGRKPVFVVTAGLIAFFGLATAFCTTYAQLVTARFLVGFGVGGLTVPFDTLSEMLPTNSRGRNLLYIEYFWTFGSLGVALVAYLTLNGNTAGCDGDGENGGSRWPLFVIICSIPCILSTVLGCLLVPESPRWLLEHNPTPERCEKALIALRKAAVLNGHDPMTLFPDGTQLTAENVHEKHHREEDAAASNLSSPKKQRTKHNHTNSLTELFSPAWRRIMLLLCGAWFGLGFLYYGVILAVSIVFTEGGNQDEAASQQQQYYDDDKQCAVAPFDFDYMAIFISASAEIFGLLAVIYTIDSWGRIKSQTVSYIVGGISGLLLGLSVEYQFSRPVLILFAFLSRMAMMASSCTTWVSTSEILVTEIRATGHGAVNALARMGGFLCPYFITDGNSPVFIGTLVFVMAMGTSACTACLPETAGKAMGDVLDDSVVDHVPEKPPTDSLNGHVSTSYQMI
mmetsp:Transcript_62603/g.152410  ORF Transcript_62603/g.152410 Transcript_62603/m.152410 type:complete len:592 (-) Transcript_62603:207-1982(-)